MRDLLPIEVRTWKRVELSGAYPIDNNLAERQARPLAEKRKSILHYGSDEGARMSSIYHSIIKYGVAEGKVGMAFLRGLLHGSGHGLGCTFVVSAVFVPVEPESSENKQTTITEHRRPEWA